MTERTDTIEYGSGRGGRWAAAGMLMVTALWTKPWVPAWAFMWVMTAALFFGFKILVAHGTVDWRWLLLWPGMDPRAFEEVSRRPQANRWGRPILTTVLGAIMVWVIARHVTAPLLAGWIGMVGFIFLLHFGCFHLLALAWRAAGVEVQPLMRNPLASLTLAEFWGARWNRGFSDVARREVFRPLVPRVGAPTAQITVFLFSGLIHELVISVPAGGGYGLPTLYFLLQAAAASWQRRPRHAAWAKGVHGRLFTLLVAGAPAFWLFPPVWVERVFVPFLHVIHAL